MAVKMTLVKGPFLQKLLVLTLLTFAGLGYPPPLCEAIKCYDCEGSCESQSEKECKSGNSCLLFVGSSGRKAKDCAEEAESYFKCVIGKVGGGSNGCSEGTKEQYLSALTACTPNLGHRSDTASERTGGFFNGIQGRNPDSQEGGKMCICSGNLCNTATNLNLGGGKGLQAVIIGSITILATNWLFY